MIYIVTNARPGLFDGDQPAAPISWIYSGNAHFVEPLGRSRERVCSAELDSGLVGAVRNLFVPPPPPPTAVAVMDPAPAAADTDDGR